MDQNEIKKTLELIKQHKPEGFDVLYNKYFRFMFGIAYSVLNKESDCYDVIQNVMLRLYTMDEGLFLNGHEAAWLHTVVKNEALMYLRREKQAVPLDEVQELPVQDLEIEKFVDMDAFDSMTASLNSKQKQIVSMKVLGGMTHKEIAKVLSIPIGTVQWIYICLLKSCAARLVRSQALFSFLEPALRITSSHTFPICRKRVKWAQWNLTRIPYKYRRGCLYSGRCC